MQHIYELYTQVYMKKYVRQALANPQHVSACHRFHVHVFLTEF